jgi:hypothetical protein
MPPVRRLEGDAPPDYGNPPIACKSKLVYSCLWVDLSWESSLLSNFRGKAEFFWNLSSYSSLGFGRVLRLVKLKFLGKNLVKKDLFVVYDRDL